MIPKHFDVVYGLQEPDTFSSGATQMMVPREWADSKAAYNPRHLPLAILTVQFKPEVVIIREVRGGIRREGYNKRTDKPWVKSLQVAWWHRIHVEGVSEYFSTFRFARDRADELTTYSGSFYTYRWDDSQRLWEVYRVAP